jgi:hypothetical protein
MSNKDFKVIESAFFLGFRIGLSRSIEELKKIRGGPIETNNASVVTATINTINYCIKVLEKIKDEYEQNEESNRGKSNDE